MCELLFLDIMEAQHLDTKQFWEHGIRASVPHCARTASSSSRGALPAPAEATPAEATPAEAAPARPMPIYNDYYLKRIEPFQCQSSPAEKKFAASSKRGPWSPTASGAQSSSSELPPALGGVPDASAAALPTPEGEAGSLTPLAASGAQPSATLPMLAQEEVAAESMLSMLQSQCILASSFKEKEVTASLAS